MKVQVKIKKKKSQTVIGSLQENSGEFCYCFIEVGSYFSILSDDIKLRKKKEHAFFEVNDGYQNNYPPVVPTSSSWRQ